MLLLGLAVMFALLYLGIQVYYFVYWQKTPIADTAPLSSIRIGATVVIIARNEANNISQCLRDLLDQDYPADLMEIIVIDDHSTDQTADVVRSMNDPRIACYALSDFQEYIRPPAFKKSAIKLAVDRARYDTIVVTDADCHHPASWLTRTVYHFHQRHASFQTGPVMITRGDSMLERLQETEQMLLMIITGAGITSALHDIASAANMAFSKKAFLTVGGYQGNEHYASGDDMFLVEKMREAFPDQIYFLKSIHATVTTDGKKTWHDLFQQRLRWAGKNKGLQNSLINRIWLFVGSYHILMIMSVILALLSIGSWWAVMILFGIKWLTDFMLLRSVTSFFQKKYLLRDFIPLQFLYGYYLVALGILMIMGKKGDWQRE